MLHYKVLNSIQMPITSSAKKALRASKRKRVFNVSRKAAIDIQVKKLKKLVAGKKVKEAKEMISSIYKAFDKAAKTGFIKHNTASRKKSRINALVKKIAK
jgi:small subunit ribosomal protein S20